MNVADIMTASPVTIKPHCSVQSAMETMMEIRCHHLPVLSYDKHLVGIVSDYDCHRALSNRHIACDSQETSPEKIPVNCIMTAAPTTIAPESSVVEAARLMFSNNIRCLPVMREETLIGIITTSDILIAFIQMNNNYDNTTPITNNGFHLASHQ